ncbi:acetolactate synthase large subunit [Acidipropionibacterium acidipropionici]|uniref:acetolactate synthase large subunit n=1 Tax=Acidipropionibacterium acidipropionici TaxID=1748 RepID=UPI00040D76A0|nr:acetolactate synthase large subunit [Acidipropionibacterium acidipropionici]ALN14719.1 acetolactate synthase [Acidipropionibacterium acidipropionici]APZ09526.1 acetolactate synthase large subunit [Acidipropionibacterium acidipropionici]
MATVADLIADCLHAEGVSVVFGLPGEENTRIIQAISDRPDIRFILVHHEQAASFMADVYGRLTGRAGVCLATLGPGAINLLLGVADATTDSAPVVAISAQVGLDRIYKESHQVVALTDMFAPVTKWSDTVASAQAVPEMMRKAFDLAQAERPGATYLAVPEDVEAQVAPADLGPLHGRPGHRAAADLSQVWEAIDLLSRAKSPVILAGHGVVRDHAGPQLRRFAETLNLPVATTFQAKGALPDSHPNALGVVGFMRHDYENFAFDNADVIISVGYELQEFAPSRINPGHDKDIIHVNRFAQDVDDAYQITVGIESDVSSALDTLSQAAELANLSPFPWRAAPIRRLQREELERGARDDSFPLTPQRVVADTRAALGPGDIVLVDTGAVKMWMARLYQTEEPNTCVISNGLSTMAWTLPGAIGAHFAAPDRKVLAVMGDGSFLMNSQELATAVRQHLPLVALVWQDDSYGLIKWKMDLELGRHSQVDFVNPDLVAYAESFGAHGHRITRAGQLGPVLREALADGGVHVIACPVDYRENMALTDRLGELTINM